jgi:hypothetical protein
MVMALPNGAFPVIFALHAAEKADYTLPAERLSLREVEYK